ncbi:MAG: hypothetical protein QOJ66_133 [Ilumatobacteraceae bacterium]
MPIRKLLIANRGEIAVRVIGAARSLGIRTVAVYSDADATARFVELADESVRLPGVLPSDTYLDGAAVLAAARLTGADAIHPGYGFLSENALFATACADAGIVFVGPPPSAIEQMGDKLRAKKMMAAAGVPVLPGTTVSDGSLLVVQRALEAVGYPAIVKASAGGGGLGMRIVNSAGELEAALASARREAGAAFGDETVFIERYVSPARHIEVQVIADDHGNVTSLFERECSIQRRHQKIVEEAPSPSVDPETRARLCAAAVAAARAVDYRGVGTVEFVAAADGTFAFLEMNTRLQVEHPVTEAITGIDLVQWQLRIAAGEPLDESITAARVTGHAIEVRLCAEDPSTGYLPSSGPLHIFELGGPGLRVDTGFESGSVVSPYYDSMLAKVIAWGRTRSEAAVRLADGLERARIHGVATNRDLLVRVLRSVEFVTGDTTTDFLERVVGLTDALTGPDAVIAHAGVAAIVHLEQLRGRTATAAVPAGWRNNRSQLERVDMVSDDVTTVVRCDLTASPPSVIVDDVVVAIDHVVLAPSERGITVDAVIEGIRRRFDVVLLGELACIDSGLGSSTFTFVDRLPAPVAEIDIGSQVAPMPGCVIRILVEIGDVVEAGQALVVLEAMKMEHTLSSPHDGFVSLLHAKEGDQVERGAVLVSVEPHPNTPNTKAPTT